MEITSCNENIEHIASTDERIQSYIPLMIAIMSKELNRYIELENDECYSIGLMAIQEALEKYEPSKGKFSTFLRVVILSRLKDHWRKENKNKVIYLEDYEQQELSSSNNYREEESLKVEILSFKEDLKKFDITFELLVEKAPRYKVTRENAIKLGEEISEHQSIIKHLYLKLKLPIVKVVSEFNTTKKFVKTHKMYITSVVVVYKEKYELIKGWLSGI